ncbi:MAG: di-heme oxidoredictase family protein [Planctomycetota bacterium]
MALHPRTRSTGLSACLATALMTTVASADLSGTSFDVTVSHTGVFATSSSTTHSYGSMETLADPNAMAFTMDLESPASGLRGNSISIDFSNFGLGDFAGETGSLTIDNIAEDIDPTTLILIDGNAQVVGSVSGLGSSLSATWQVDDILPFLAPTITVAWDSLSGFEPVKPQPAAGEPLAGLTLIELDRFNLGKDAFEQNFLPEDGLGPVFNKQSCANCHNNPIGGSGAQTVTRFGQAGKGGFTGLDGLGGSLLQQSAISPDCLEDIPAEANVFAQRLTPSVLGGGLIEAIEDADILANIQPGPDVTGVARMVNPLEDPGSTIVGRFSWKAGVGTILTFSGDAALNEMGLTNRLVLTENDPNGTNPPELADCDTVPDPEDGPEGGVPGAPHFIDRVTDFQRFLAAPPQTPKSGMTGETVFNNLGCAVCHTAEYTTRVVPGLEDAIAGQVIRPYSDFLVHDMGLAADFIADGPIGEREIRTPALWGLSLRDPLWHDGRFGAGTFASRVTDAIMEHGAALSEGEASAEAFDMASFDDKQALIAFLESLGRREFDVDRDNHIDMTDYLDFVACLGSGITPDDACAIHDIDQDGDVDPDDFASFLLVFEGPLTDCNANANPDISDIVNGSSTDANNNGIPDECECPTDCAPDNGDGTFGNGEINIDDLLAVINAFGAAGANPCDVAPDNGDGTFGNGIVNIDDVLEVINTFGPCS